jgi:hypothetical protein
MPLFELLGKLTLAALRDDIIMIRVAFDAIAAVADKVTPALQLLTGHVAAGTTQQIIQD